MGEQEPAPPVRRAGRAGLPAGQKLVGRLLKRLGFSLQANAKTREGASHPDRNAQFEHINAQVTAFQAAGEPAITVCHLPPGISKWNRIEHRPFAFITQNWRGKPLLSHQVIIQLIANTRTSTGLTVACRIDANAYDKGIRVSDAEMAALNIQTDDFHDEWNYIFTPRQPDG